MGMYFKLLRSSWDDFALCAGVLAGFFLVAHIVTAVVLAFFFDGTSLIISGMILPIVSAFLILIYSLSYSGFQFSHLVRLGCTRRRSLSLTLGAAAAVALFCMLLSALLAWLDRLWRGYTETFGTDPAFERYILFFAGKILSLSPDREGAAAFFRSLDIAGLAGP